MSHRTGGFSSGRPVSSRARIDGEVEAETVDVHFPDPVPQAVEDHAPHDRLIGVQRVAGAAVIGDSGRGPGRGCNTLHWRGRGKTGSVPPASPSAVWL